MKNLITLLILSLVALSAYADKGSEKPSMAPTLSNLAQTLDLLFTAPVPGYTNSARFFYTNYKFSTPLGAQLQGALNQLIAEDSPRAASLNKMINRGVTFKRQYVSAMEGIFGEGFRDLAISPYAAVLEKLRQQILIVNKTKERRLTEQEARTQALVETLSRFGLPREYSVSDLENKKLFDPRHSGAYQYFTRRFFALQEQSKREDRPNDFDVDAFKAQVLKEVQILRSTNFVFGYKWWSGTTRRRLKLVSGPIQTFLNDKSKIDFVGFSAGPVNARLVPDRVSRVDSEIKKLANRVGQQDWSGAEGYYALYPTSLLQPHGVVEFKVDDQRYIVSEADYASAMNSLITETPTVTGKLSLYARLAAETQSRDAIYSELTTFLSMVNDRSAQDLQARLLGQVDKGEVKNFPHHTLAGFFLIYPHDQKRADPLTSIRWAGYAENPDYWNVRDTMALEARRGALDSEKLLPPNTVSERTLNKIEKKETQAQVIRNQDVRTQALTRTKRLAAGSVSTFVLSALAYLGAVNIKDEITFVVNLGREQLYKIENLVQNVATQSGAAFRSDLSKAHAVRMQRLTSPENFNINQSQAEASDTESGRENHSAPVFEIKPVQSSSIPNYFDLMTEDNLAQLKKEFDKPDNHDDFLRVVDANGVRESAQFELESKSEVFVIGGLAPIPAPYGYTVSAITVTDQSGNYVNKKDYRVEINPHTGLLVLDFQNAKKHYNSIHYRVSYVGSHNSEEVSNIPIDPGVLQISVIGKLQELGAKDLSEQLTAYAGNLSLGNWGSAMAASGLYTFDHFVGPRPGDRNKAFGGYIRFLDEDGIFHYQCTGSNSLLYDLIQAYRAADPTVRDVQVQRVQGYLRDSGSRFITEPGHMHLLAYRLSAQNSYTILDATPVAKEPSFQKMKKVGRKVEEFWDGITDRLGQFKRSRQSRMTEKIAENQDSFGDSGGGGASGGGSGSDDGARVGQDDSNAKNQSYDPQPQPQSQLQPKPSPPVQKEEKEPPRTEESKEAKRDLKFSANLSVGPVNTSVPIWANVSNILRPNRPIQLAQDHKTLYLPESRLKKVPKVMVVPPPPPPPPPEPELEEYFADVPAGPSQEEHFNARMAEDLINKRQEVFSGIKREAPFFKVLDQPEKFAKLPGLTALLYSQVLAEFLLGRFPMDKVVEQYVAFRQRVFINLAKQKIDFSNDPLVVQLRKSNNDHAILVSLLVELKTNFLNAVSAYRNTKDSEKLPDLEYINSPEVVIHLTRFMDALIQAAQQYKTPGPSTCKVKMFRIKKKI